MELLQFLNVYKYKLILAFILCIIYTNICLSQSDSNTIPKISEIKRLPADELAEKKEGYYFTGVPDLSLDPINGFGYGIEGTFYYHGKKSDPLFAYTPYRSKLDLALFNTTKSSKELSLKFDVPYILNTNWRLRTEFLFETNPNLLYFGNTSNSLNGLQFYDNGDSNGQLIQNGSYQNYEKSLIGNRAFYNLFTKKESVINMTIERSFFEGKVRCLVGYEFAKFINSTNLNYLSKLAEDNQKNNVMGLGMGEISMIQVGLVYDTRNLETDPSSGYFAELTHENSFSAIGSQFNFHKTFFQMKGYHLILKKFFKKQILSWRTGWGYTHGNAPFFEYADEWSSEGSIEGLGGSNTIRGFKQSRFMARMMNFNNFELRSQLFTSKIFNQHFAFAAVPFFDFGGCWDKINQFNLKNYRTSQGLGLRIVWNINTVLRFDYAISKEDRQFFFQMNHTF